MFARQATANECDSVTTPRRVSCAEVDLETA